MATWVPMDNQMSSFSRELVEIVKLNIDDVNRLATKISSEVRFLDEVSKSEIANASLVPISARLHELQAFQSWMDISRQPNLSKLPAVVRAKVITQNYICFCYLPESCFSVLRKRMPPDSATYKCAKFLTDNPVRAFRNTIAYSNWTYEKDFSGLVYWARKGANSDEPLEQFSVKGNELDFWQALSRCLAYAAFSNL